MFVHTLSAETLALVIDALPVRLFWKDRESRVIGCNMLYARDCGAERPEDVIGKTDYFFHHGEQARAFRIDDAQVMASGESKLGIIEQLTLDTGETRWLETNKVPLRDHAGQIIGVLGTYQDITDRIRGQRAA